MIGEGEEAPALGFQPSGHVDNLPQGVRELLFYKRIPPRSFG